MIGADQLGFQHLAPRLAAALVLGATGLAGGCAASPSYMGLNLAAPELPTELRDLARRAQAGDKQAQLDLGIAFEEGRGVARDLGMARRLYAQAASDSGGTVWVYAPSPGGGAPAHVVSVDRGPKQAGMVAAKTRLQLLGDMSGEY